MVRRSTAAWRAVLAVLGAAVLLAGCSGGSSSAGSEPVADPSGAFPTTIRHAFGETTIPSKPQRVVTLGTGGLAIADAVGAPIVGAAPSPTETGPNLPYATHPLGPEVFGLSPDSIDFERVASYRPDLILAVYSPTIEAGSYETLSQIAPVVTFERSLFGSTMEQDARLIGKALGEQDAVERLTGKATAEIERVKRELPGLARKTYLYGQARGPVLPLVVGERNLSTRFMGSLGLQVPPEFANASATDELAPGTIGVSYEHATRLGSADLLFMTFAATEDRARFESNGLVRSLPAVTEGRYFPLPMDTAVALQAPNAAAVPWLLEQLRPALERVGR